ncbi:MAG: Ldh family oxidoreductase [Anaerolineae bacterium]|nr:Ldh family oxidoreductase [Anaerolineae bacterium]
MTAEAASIRVSPPELEAFVAAAMQRVGIRDEDARLAAQILVTTDTWGVHTHGTRQLRPLLRNFPIERLHVDAMPEVVREGGAWALIDGHHGLPFVAAVRAMDMAIAKAKLAGVGYVSVVNTSHFGAAGYYATRAALAGMIGMAMCNTDPQMAIPGARGKVLGTNPIAYAIPYQDKPIFFDIATSAVAANKVIRAKLLGQKIPEGWLVDADGNPTTDPSDFPESGALLPMALHKGYGFALLVETLAGVMTGAAMARQQPSWVVGVPSNPPGFANQGQVFMAIDAGMMLSPSQFEERIDWLADDIHDAPKAAGSERTYLPGEMEWERRERALRDGLELPPDVVTSLIGLAEDVGLSFPFAANSEGG